MIHFAPGPRSFRQGMSAPFLFDDQARMTDICGAGAFDAMQKISWMYRERPWTALAIENDDVVGVGWCAEIQFRGSLRAPGLTIAFAVREDCEGRGIATAVACQSFLNQIEANPGIEGHALVLMQCRDGNAAAVRIAERLGFCRIDRQSFKTRNDVDYAGFVMTSGEFIPIAQSVIKEFTGADMALGTRRATLSAKEVRAA